MTPHMDGETGTLILDRVFPGVGRIKRASGQPDTKLGRRRFEQMDRMLTDLYQGGQHDYLKKLKRREIHPLQLWSAYQAKKLDDLPTPELMESFGDAFQRWIDTSPTGKHNKTQRQTAHTILTALWKGATVGDTPDLLQRYQTRCEAQGKRSMFNHVRVHVLRFLDRTLGKEHALRARAGRVEQMKVTVKRKRGLTLTEARALWAWLPDHASHAFRELCLTGMRPAEYLSGEWQILQDRIEVYGTKTGAADRAIPLVQPITGSGIRLANLQYHLKRWPDAKVEPYTARRTFMGWMEEAGIPRARRKMYLGHGIKDVSDLYERVHHTAYLKEDAEKLRAFIGITGVSLLKSHGRSPKQGVK